MPRPTAESSTRRKPPAGGGSTDGKLQRLAVVGGGIAGLTTVRSLAQEGFEVDVFGSLLDPGARLGVGGDWCHRSRVEGAYLSGLSLAQRTRKERFPARNAMS